MHKTGGTGMVKRQSIVTQIVDRSDGLTECSSSLWQMKAGSFSAGSRAGSGAG